MRMFAGLLVVEVEGPFGLDSWAAMMIVYAFVGVACCCNGLLGCNYLSRVAQKIGKINHGKGIWYLSGRPITLWLITVSGHIYLRRVGFSLPSFLPTS